MDNGKLSPTWYVEYRLNGTHVIKSTGCTTKKAALAWAKDIAAPVKGETAARVLVERHRDLLMGHKPIPLADMTEIFRKTRAHTQVGPWQGKHHIAVLADFVAWMNVRHPSVKNMQSVTKEHAAGYIDHISKNGRFIREVKDPTRGTVTVMKPAPLSASTANQYYSTLRLVFKELQPKTGMLENSFHSKLRARKVIHVQRKVFTDVELAAVAEASKQTFVAKDEPESCLYLLLRLIDATALRHGDAACLRWADVDLTPGREVITGKCQKTGTVYRCPLLPGMAEWLRGRLAAMPGQEYVLPWFADHFQHRRNNDKVKFNEMLVGLGMDITADSITPHSITPQPADKQKKRRAVSIRGFHALRHGTLTRLELAGVPGNLIKLFAGHANKSMTDNYTSHSNDIVFREKMSRAPSSPFDDGPRQISHSATVPSGSARDKLLALACRLDEAGAERLFGMAVEGRLLVLEQKVV
jgi:integrase